jgi:hypothetical protein
VTVRLMVTALTSSREITSNARYGYSVNTAPQKNRREVKRMDVMLIRAGAEEMGPVPLGSCSCGQNRSCTEVS